MTPDSYAFRIIFIIGEFLALVVFVAYSATLVSIFTTPNTPIKSIGDLLQSQLRLLVDVNNAGANLVVSKLKIQKTNHNATSLAATNKHSSITNLLINRVSKGGKNSFASAPNATAVLISRKLAFMTFPDTFYSTMKNVHKRSDKYLCDHISSVPVTSIPFRSGLFIAKNSVYKQLFNVK